MSIADLRKDYTQGGLREEDLAPNPIVQFQRWFEEARAAGVLEPNAMVLATVDARGQPSSRVVLLKGVDARGFSFFTNYESRKGRELAENPRSALSFFWPALERQVCIAGRVSRLPRAAAAEYFQSRPKGSRLGAWVSRQSSVVPDREFLEARMRALETKYSGPFVPLPPYWGGYRLRPERVEFWQGRPNRLHDRLSFTRVGRRWRWERLSP